jgi:hypothetical protein
MSLAKIAASLAAITTLGFNSPAFAHATHPAHLLARAAVCSANCGPASAQWVNDHSHSHGTLSLTASGCTLTGAFHTEPPQLGGSQSGGVVNAKGLPVQDLSFDYETEYCGIVSQQFVFVYVTTTEGGSFFEECEFFPNPNNVGQFTHEKFTNSQFGFTDGSHFDTIEIGLFNGLSQGIPGEALVKNIVVDGIPAIPDFHQSVIDFCSPIQIRK